MRKTALNKLQLIPDFLNVDFTKNTDNISIKQFVKKFYDNKRIDVLISIFRYLEPENNYINEHNYTFFYHERFDSYIDLCTSYNPRTKKYEPNEEAIEYHVNIDCQILSNHAHTLDMLKNELNTILKGIEEAQKLNEKIASVYKDISDLDAQEIWRYHDHLYTECFNSFIAEELDLAMENIKIDEIPYYTCDDLVFSDEDEDEDEAEDDRYIKEIVSRIHKKQKKDKLKNMPLFDYDKYKEMLGYQNSPHINPNEGKYLIANFAGKSTALLEKRLKDVNLQLAAPVRHPVTGAWNYTIDYTFNFIGLIYQNFLEYINSMLDGIGFIPTCAWCKNPISPTSQQLQRLRKNENIYCRETFKTCKRQGTTNKQNEKRNNDKKRVKG